MSRTWLTMTNYFSNGDQQAKKEYRRKSFMLTICNVKKNLSLFQKLRLKPKLTKVFMPKMTLKKKKKKGRLFKLT